MDIFQLMAMTMQQCQEYAQKSAHTTLTEYEMLCYEQCCNTVAQFLKIKEMDFIISLRQFRKDNPELFDDEEGAK